MPVRIMGAKHGPVQLCLIQHEMEQLINDFTGSKEHIVIKFARFHIGFDTYHEKNDISAMDKLFAKYLNEILNMYLRMLSGQEKRGV